MTSPHQSKLDLGAWLASLGCAAHAAAFAAHDITPDLLPTLTDEDLQELGVSDAAQRALLLAAIAAGPTQPPAPQPPSPPAPRRVPPSPERRSMTAPPRVAPLAAPRPAAQPVAPQPPPQPPPQRPVASPPAPAPQPEAVPHLTVAPQKKQLIVPRSLPPPAAPVAFQPAAAQPAPASNRTLLIALIALSTLTVTGIGILVGLYLARKPPPVTVASPPPAAQPPPATTAARPPAPTAKVSVPAPSPVILLAREAKLHGVALDKTKTVIQGWNKPGNQVEWRIAIRAPGRYDVKASYSKYGGTADLLLTCAGQKVQAKLGSTGAWTRFKDTGLGSMHIAKAGDYTVQVKSANPKAAVQIHLRSLTLVPIP
jgi:hypothetical protein